MIALLKQSVAPPDSWEQEQRGRHGSRPVVRARERTKVDTEESKLPRGFERRYLAQKRKTTQCFISREKSSFTNTSLLTLYPHI